MGADSEFEAVRSIAGKERKNALDDLCDSFDHVGAGIGHFVHDGWVRPHPIGHCPDSASGQSHSGAKSLVAVSGLAGRSLMRINPITLVGIALIVLGIVAFAYQGITYTSREKIIDIGPIQATADTQKTIPLSPLLGGLALVGGIVLVVVGAKKS
jgi:uncharacterized membrane protein